MTSGFLDESDFSDCLENLGNHLLLSVFKGEGQNRGCSLLIIVITTHWTCQVALEAKNPPASAGDVKDMGSVPGSGRSPEGGHGNPLQCSCLENPMDRGAWRARVHKIAKSQTRLKRLRTHYINQ